MDNYYLALGIDAAISQNELETIWEEKYNEVRRLVTHHDPSVVDEANRTLRVLESARNVLFDPAKRAEYTARLLDHSTAGLGDPTASPAPSKLTPPGTPRIVQGVPQQVQQQQQPRLDAWMCMDCKRENPLRTQFCASCGTQIAKACPNCGVLEYLENTFCPNCGVNKEDAFQKNKQTQMASMNANISKYEKTLQTYNKAKNSYYSFDAEIKRIHKETQASGCGIIIINSIIIIGTFYLAFMSESGFLALIVAAGATYLILLVRKLSRESELTKIINELKSNIRMEKNRIAELKKETYTHN